MKIDQQIQSNINTFIAMSTRTKQIQKYVFDPEDQLDASGSYGIVYKGRHIANDSVKVAIKTIKKATQDIQSQEFKLLLNQYEIVKSVNGQGVVKNLTFGLVKWNQSKHKYAIVQELMDGNLEKLFKQKIKDRKKKELTQEQAQIWMKKIVRCYDDIYKAKIIHRDLKPQNILFKYGQNNQLIFKIGDFGLITFDNSCTKDTQLGTKGFRAPEIMTQDHYSYKVDIFSLGCILLNLLSGIKNNIQQLKIVTKKNQNKVDHGLLLNYLNSLKISPITKEFIIGCLRNQPNERFQWDTLINHSFIRTKNDVLTEETQKKILQFFSNHDITSKYMFISSKELEAYQIPELNLQLTKNSFTQTIIQIQIGNNKISSAGIKVLFPQGSTKFPRLEQLEAQSCQLGKQGVQFLANHNFPSLYSLDISKNDIKEGIQYILQLKINFPRLKSIDLTKNGITLNDIQFLKAKNLKFPHSNATLAIFNGNQIDDSQINRNKLKGIFVQARFVR